MGRFVPKNVYFIVSFEDEKLKIPVIQTLIYERLAVRNDGTRCFLFTEIQQYAENSLFYVDEDDEHIVVDRKGLIASLEKLNSLTRE